MLQTTSVVSVKATHPGTSLRTHVVLAVSIVTKQRARKPVKLTMADVLTAVKMVISGSNALKHAATIVLRKTKPHAVT